MEVYCRGQNALRSRFPSGLSVDKEFLEYLRGRVGIEAVAILERAENETALQRLLRNWHRVSHGFLGSEVTAFEIELPAVLLRAIRSSSAISDTELFDDDCDTLLLLPQDVRNIFNCFIAQLLQRIRVYIRSASSQSPPSVIVFTGGMSSSSYVVERLTANFAATHRVLIPPRADEAVLIGAALQGQFPAAFAS